MSIASILSGPVKDLIESGWGIADKFITTPQEKLQWEQEKLRQQLALDSALREHEAKIIESINATMREEAKSDKWAQWLWRPVIGFVFGGVIVNNYILLPYFANYGLAPIIIPDGVWSAMLIILGVSAGTRGIEKVFKAKNGN